MSSAKSAKRWAFRHEGTFASQRDACFTLMYIWIESGHGGRRLLRFL